MINFDGHLIVPTEVSAVSPVKTISTGSAHCQFKWGFEVILKSGNVLTFSVSNSDYINRSVQRNNAEKKRKEFISLLK